MELQGTIGKIVSEKSGKSDKTGNEWTACEVLVNYQAGQNNKQALFNVFGADKCANLKTIKEGAPVKVVFDIETNEWQGRHFVKLSAWSVSLITPVTKQPELPTEPPF